MSHKALVGAVVLAVLAVLTFLVSGAAAQSLGGPGLGGPTNDQLTNHRSGTLPFDISPAGLTPLNSRKM